MDDGDSPGPDYYLEKTRDWLVLPYELSGFSVKELRENRPEMADLIDRLEPHVSPDGITRG